MSIHASCKIGIMADSHGRSETIAAAVRFLKRRGCRRIYHLGDISDSITPETVDRCVALIRGNGIYAIKGNNDHAVVVNQKDRKKPLISPETLGYLKALPLMRYEQGACLTHSLPFADERGLSSMIGAMDEVEAHQYFRRMPQGVLFRGHSHSPEAIFLNQDEIHFHPLQKGAGFNLKQHIPCIVTCGALTRGLCVVWRPDSGRIDCLEYAAR